MAESAIPQTINEEEFKRWLSPRRTFQILEKQWDHEVIWSTLTGMLYHGQLYARAGTLKHVRFDFADALFNRALLPKDAWNPGQPSLASHFWQNGRLDYALGYRSDKREYACFDVRFDPDVVRGLLEDDEPEPPQASEPLPLVARSNLGGRPRLEFWEPLLIEMFDQLWHGKLAPKTQADIEGAMHNWLSANSHSASERAVRQRAQSLWKVWTKEGNN